MELRDFFESVEEGEERREGEGWRERRRAFRASGGEEGVVRSDFTVKTKKVLLVEEEELGLHNLDESLFHSGFGVR